MSRPRNPVWKVYDLVVDGATVYVGCSHSPRARYRAHIKRGIIDASATLQIVSVHKGDASAARAEQRRIRKLKPLFNLKHNERATADRIKATTYAALVEHDPLWRGHERIAGLVLSIWNSRAFDERGDNDAEAFEAVNEMLVSMGKAGLQLGSPATARRVLGKRPRKRG